MPSSGSAYYALRIFLLGSKSHLIHRCCEFYVLLATPKSSSCNSYLMTINYCDLVQGKLAVVLMCISKGELKSIKIMYNAKQVGVCDYPYQTRVCNMVK